MENVQKYGLWAAKIIAGFAFVAASLAKLAGVEMMIQTFDAFGFGQWFRYVTGIIEIGAGIALFVPGIQALGAALLSATMVGAIIAHFTVLGTETMFPAVVLLVLSLIVLGKHRDQLPVG